MTKRVTLCNKPPSRRSSKVPGTLTGDRTQGSQQYSIWATCVDWRAAQRILYVPRILRK
ncbi:hypothetical protein GCM10010261_12600 [Streptomyces pilosus]|uniref:Uncharacterized protein n=1 Tax=Streptomyces pilosus TaxID=28893 RepID=A0A918EWP3_9ACTN|nr:hypothetical protein GCM10010280_26850 [Streptomyces pilosus]GGV40991.1 hypothetical protein GCM10010261_12600 [Streptomyces pilosus]